MTLDYQVIIDMYVQMTLYALPLAVIMLICEKLISIMQKFWFGKEVKV